MNQNTILLFMIAFSLFGLQAVGGVFQMKSYKIAIKRMHKKGNVGIGQKRGRFFNGHIVLIACDKERRITGCEILDGMTFISKFHEVDKVLSTNLIGTTIDELKVEIEKLGKKQKRYKGYLDAIYALELRLETK